MKTTATRISLLDRRFGSERASRSGALKLGYLRRRCPAVTPGETRAADRGSEAGRAAYRQAYAWVRQGDDPPYCGAADRRRSWKATCQSASTRPRILGSELSWIVELPIAMKETLAQPTNSSAA